MQCKLNVAFHHKANVGQQELESVPDPLLPLNHFHRSLPTLGPLQLASLHLYALEEGDEQLHLSHPQLSKYLPCPVPCVHESMVCPPLTVDQLSHFNPKLGSLCKR